MPSRAPNYEVVARHDAGPRRYARQRTWAERWKWRLTILAALLGGGWLLAGFVRPGGERRYTHGPVASVHAAWDAKCDACHQPTGDAALADVFAVSDRWAKLTCEKCHAGPAHHATATDAGSCASCHHDHQGRLNSLVRIADSHCTRCHANLSAYHRDGKTDYANAVADFAGHPEFRKLRDGGKVERSLKFSHALHLAPGVAMSADDRAAMKRDGKLVQLECASCHQLDNNDRAEGAYFLPVRFEAHCQSCHPLGTGELTAGGVKLPPVEVPHRVQPAGLREHLSGQFARALFAANPALADRPSVPFERLSAEPAAAAATFRADVAAAVESAMRKMLAEPAAAGTSGGTCTKCHDLGANGSDVTVRPARVPAVWFEHAKFSHVSHRGVECKQCHPTNVPLSQPINEREPANIRGVQSCRECHSPAGGVRHGCTDCHRYHNGDHPLQGRGATARVPREPLTVEAFLRGGR